MNLVVIRGTLSSEPRETVLPSGTVLLNWEVTTDTPDGKWSVPVRWVDPSAVIQRIGEGDEVIVRGGVRRRYAKVGGVTRSFVEVIAQRATKPSRTKETAKILANAQQDLVDAVLVPSPASAP